MLETQSPFEIALKTNNCPQGLLVGNTMSTIAAQTDTCPQGLPTVHPSKPRHT